MAWQNGLYSIPGLQTVTDLSNSIHRFVKITGNNQVGICDGATDVPVGVLQDNPEGSAGTPKGANVMAIGVSKVVAGEALTAGMKVSTDDNGAAIELVAGNQNVGQVIEGAGNGAVATIAINCINAHEEQ